MSKKVEGKKSSSKKQEKTKEDKKIIKSEKNILKTKQNIQVLWLLSLMIAIILIIFIVPYVKTNIVNKFEYMNLDFYKTKLGEIPFYSTKIPLVDIAGNAIGTYNINLREDPRDLEYINVEIPNDIIDFTRNKENYISLPSDLPICENNIIAVTSLIDFLENFGNMEFSIGMVNETYALETGFPYVTCETHPTTTIILINQGEETSIKREGTNCYELTFNECEINEVSEKFIYEIVDNYMDTYVKRFGKP